MGGLRKMMQQQGPPVLVLNSSVKRGRKKGTDR